MVISVSLRQKAYETWTGLAGRHPSLHWVSRWGLSLFSVVAGLVTLFLFRRGIEHFPWILGNLLLIWVAGVVFAHVWTGLEARNHRLVRVAVDYTLQSLHHEQLLFLLPIYYASTTFSSRNAAFFLLHLAAAVLTAIDPWYRATFLRYRWTTNALFAFGFFASLNVGLPLIHVRSGWALILSSFLSLAALTPAIRRKFSLTWRKAASRAALAGILAAIAVWSVRAWIPPGPLYLSTATFARSVAALEPVYPVEEVSAADVRAWGGLVCFTAVSAPAGLREPIYHFWRKDGLQVAQVALSPIRGGRPGGFRTYSQRTDLGADPVGHWTVDVLTAQGQLIGRVRLIVTP